MSGHAIRTRVRSHGQAAAVTGSRSMPRSQLVVGAALVALVAGGVGYGTAQARLGEPPRAGRGMPLDEDPDQL